MLRVFLVFLLACLVPGLAAAETRISFQTPGASDDLRDDLRAASLTVSTGRNGTAQDLLAAAQADYARLLGVLYQNARYGGVITIRVDGREAAAIPPLNAPGQIDTIRIEVRPGPLYRLSTARIGPLAPGTALPEGFRPGAPAGSATLQDATTAAIDGWRADGRAKARVTAQSIIARHDANQVSASIAIAPGPRLRFGPTTIEGNDNVRTRRIRTIAGLPEGQVFDPDEAERAANRLRRTGSFSSVTVEEAPDIGPDSTLPMTIGVVEAIPAPLRLRRRVQHH